MRNYEKNLICNSTSSPKKEHRRSRSKEECKCYNSLIKLHHVDCPLLNRPCPLHGNSLALDLKEDSDQCMIIAYRANSKADGVFHPFKILPVNGCSAGSKVNSSPHSSPHRENPSGKEGRKIQMEADVSEKPTKNFTDKAKPCKMNKMKKLRKCFHSPCNSIVQKTRSHTSIEGRIKEIFHEEEIKESKKQSSSWIKKHPPQNGFFGRPEVPDESNVEPDLHYFCCEKLMLSDADTSSDKTVSNRTDSVFVSSPSKSGHNKTYNSNFSEVPENTKEDMKNIPCYKSKKKSAFFAPYVFYSLISNTNSELGEDNIQIKKDKVSYTEKSLSIEEVKSSEERKEQEDAMSDGTTGSDSSGSIYCTPYILVPPDMEKKTRMTHSTTQTEEDPRTNMKDHSSQTDSSHHTFKSVQPSARSYSGTSMRTYESGFYKHSLPYKVEERESSSASETPLPDKRELFREQKQSTKTSKASKTTTIDTVEKMNDHAKEEDANKKKDLSRSLSDLSELVQFINIHFDSNTKDVDLVTRSKPDLKSFYGDLEERSVSMTARTIMHKDVATQTSEHLILKYITEKDHRLPEKKIEKPTMFICRECRKVFTMVNAGTLTAIPKIKPKMPTHGFRNDSDIQPLDLNGANVDHSARDTRTASKGKSIDRAPVPITSRNLAPDCIFYPPPPNVCEQKKTIHENICITERRIDCPAPSSKSLASVLGPSPCINICVQQPASKEVHMEPKCPETEKKKNLRTSQTSKINCFTELKSFSDIPDSDTQTPKIENSILSHEESPIPIPRKTLKIDRRKTSPESLENVSRKSRSTGTKFVYHALVPSYDEFPSMKFSKASKDLMANCSSESLPTVLDQKKREREDYSEGKNEDDENTLHPPKKLNRNQDLEVSNEKIDPVECFVFGENESEHFGGNINTQEEQKVDLNITFSFVPPSSSAPLILNKNSGCTIKKLSKSENEMEQMKKMILRTKLILEESYSKLIVMKSAGNLVSTKKSPTDVAKCEISNSMPFLLKNKLSLKNDSHSSEVSSENECSSLIHSTPSGSEASQRQSTQKAWWHEKYQNTDS